MTRRGYHRRKPIIVLTAVRQEAQDAIRNWFRDPPEDQSPAAFKKMVNNCVPPPIIYDREPNGIAENLLWIFPIVNGKVCQRISSQEM